MTQVLGENMFNFKDLQFEDHANKPYFNTRATMQFSNGFGVSVVTGDNAYGNWEVAVTFDNALCYDSGLTEDVVSCLTESEVVEFVRKVQALPTRVKW